MKNAEQLAEKFHNTYERLAPEHGYETRKESAGAWEDVPENNKRLMIAVCQEIEGEELEPLRQLVRDFEAWAMEIAPHSYQEGRKAADLRERVRRALLEESQAQG